MKLMGKVSHPRECSRDAGPRLSRAAPDVSVMMLRPLPIAITEPLRVGSARSNRCDQSEYSELSHHRLTTEEKRHAPLYQLRA
jgi:hypothetical protein